MPYNFARSGTILLESSRKSIAKYCIIRHFNSFLTRKKYKPVREEILDVMSAVKNLCKMSIHILDAVPGDA